MSNWWVFILVIVSPILLYTLVRIIFSGIFRSYFTEKLIYENDKKGEK